MKSKNILWIVGAFVLLSGFGLSRELGHFDTKKEMIKVTIMYPNEAGKTFDMNYYSTKHMPMLTTIFGDSLKLWEIDKGISGRTADEPAPFVAIGYLYFDKLSAYENSFGPNAEQILSDIPNYTDIQPQVQISEIVR